MTTVSEGNFDYLASLSLKGKAAIVLGGGQGIGVETCFALAQAGARVMCVDLDSDRAAAMAKKVSGDAFVADVTDEAAMECVFAKAALLYGDDLTVVVDIVGMADLRPMAQYSMDEWDRQFNLVLRHAFLAVKMGAAAMAGRDASIVLVSSVAGLVSCENQGVYGIAKAGLNHLVKTASTEFGPEGIRINAVAPALTRTPRVVAGFGEELMQGIVDRVPLRRANEPKDIAAAILFFATPMSHCVSGVVMAVDGGLHLMANLPPINVGDSLLTK